MAEARARLAGAERPLILLGGTNWGAKGQAALQRFAEHSDMPVVAVFRTQDQIDNHSPAFCGHAGVGMWPATRRLIREADVILAAGVRFGENATAGYTLLDVPDPVQALIHVHASEAELGKVYRPVLGIHADPGAFMAALEPVEGGWAAWRRAARADWEAGFALPDQPSAVDMGKVIAHLQAVLPDDAILTSGAGNFAVWPGYFFRFGPGQRLLAPQSGAMGYGIPAAVSAAIAHPDRRVVCIAGDGDFQMTSQELATARQAGARILVLVVNNGSYGTIRAHQERHYPGRVAGTQMVSPDFVALARAYGMEGQRVAATVDFADAFARACESPTGALLDLAVSEEALTPRLSLSAIRAAAMAGAARG